MRERFSLRVDRILAVSEAMRRTLLGLGFPGRMIDVVQQAMPEDGVVWEAVGRDRVPGRVSDVLTVGFVGSAYPHKGPQLLVEAAQLVDCDIRVRIHGEVPRAFAEQLLSMDRRGVVELAGAFSHAELPEILRGLDAAVIPSLWWDCAPLVVAECLAGRVPVVGANMGGIPDFVEHEVNGLLFDGRSATALAAALERLHDEAGLLERLQGAIEEPRAFSDYVDQLEAIYAGDNAIAPRRAGSPVAVRWVGDQATASSLATINREVGDRLRAGHPELAFERRATDGPLGDAPTPHTPEVEVRHQWPPDLSRPAGGRLALIQPWEFGSLPRDWQAGLQQDVDEVWVPSDYTRADVPRGGRRARSRARGPERRRPRVAQPAGPARRAARRRACACCFVGGTISRKGVDVLLSAYELAFAGRDDVVLVIKDLGGSSYYRGMTMSDQLRARAESGALPRVHYIEDELTRDELAALYRACDVLVHPYRGEGFAMPVLEAMACGIPVVVTAGGPTDEFCPDDACWRIPSEQRPIADGRIGNLETIAPPWMLEPDRDALVGILHEVASDRGRAHPPRRACAPGRRAVLLGLGRRRLRRSHPRALTTAATRPGAGRAARAGRRPRARAARDAGLARHRPPRRPAARLGCRLPRERAGGALPAGRSGRRRGARAVGVPRPEGRRRGGRRPRRLRRRRGARSRAARTGRRAHPPCGARVRPACTTPAEDTCARLAPSTCASSSRTPSRSSPGTPGTHIPRRDGPRARSP